MSEKLSKACGLSWNGFSIFGDEKSVKEVRRLLRVDPGPLNDTRNPNNYLPILKGPKASLPECWGKFRSNQSDAENCCSDCEHDSACYAQWEMGVHLAHCHRGEYEGSCKYGSDNCPAAVMKKTCLTCKWWAHSDSIPECNRQCRRNPPTTSWNGDDNETSWPWTGQHDWCGEWKKKE